MLATLIWFWSTYFADFPGVTIQRHERIPTSRKNNTIHNFAP